MGLEGPPKKVVDTLCLMAYAQITFRPQPPGKRKVPMSYAEQIIPEAVILKMTKYPMPNQYVIPLSAVYLLVGELISMEGLDRVRGMLGGPEYQGEGMETAWLAVLLRNLAGHLHEPRFGRESAGMWGIIAEVLTGDLTPIEHAHAGEGFAPTPDNVRLTYQDGREAEALVTRYAPDFVALLERVGVCAAEAATEWVALAARQFQYEEKWRKTFPGRADLLPNRIRYFLRK